jgi:hypothetical protein
MKSLYKGCGLGYNGFARKFGAVAQLDRATAF